MTLPTNQEFINTVRAAILAEKESPTLIDCDTQLLGRQLAILCRANDYDPRSGTLFNELCLDRIEKIVKNADLYANYKKLLDRMCPEEQYLLEKFRRGRKRFRDANLLIQELRRWKTKYGPIPGETQDET